MIDSSGEITVKSPSNIAIVKYWGKYGRQLPRNCSLSFTLENAHTMTTLRYKKRATPTDHINLEFYFEGKLNPQFGAKSSRFLNSITDKLPYLRHYDFEMETNNTFPHSSGIASSASGMSALAGCLIKLESIDQGKEYVHDADTKQRISYFARMGSGSACRSVYKGLASWGEHPQIEGSSNEYATEVLDYVHPEFLTYHDDLLIVSKKEKSVSSTAGHGLMEDNPYAEARYRQANDNISKLLDALKNNDQHGFGQILEDEALTLHALMMCSTPSFMLMEPNTIEMIKRIRAYRMTSNLPVYFTLDAGPNIHLLYPDAITDQVAQFIESDLMPLTHAGKVIRDRVGEGLVVGE